VEGPDPVHLATACLELLAGHPDGQEVLDWILETADETGDPSPSD